MALLRPSEHDLVLNIGSGSVSGAIVDFQKDAHPKIVHTHEREFPIKEKITAEELSTYMLTALHKVMETLTAEHKKRIKTAHVMFASPWFSSFSKSIGVKKDDAFIVQEKTVEKLVDEQFAEIFNLHKNNSATNASNSTVIEKALSNIKLNGYETALPYGKSAKTLDVSVYASMVPTTVKEKIESEIYTVVHPGSIIFHTFPFAAWDVVVPLFSPQEDFIFIDIGSEITDVLTVRRGSINSLVSLPLGRNHLIRKIALNLDADPELAKSMINLYANDNAEAATKEKMANLIAAFSEEWTHRFSTATQESKNPNEHFIPQKAFFVSDQKISSVFNGMIQKQIPHVVALSRENLSQFVDFGTNEIPNIFIALGVMYLNSRFSNNQFTNPKNIL